MKSKKVGHIHKHSNFEICESQSRRVTKALKFKNMIELSAAEVCHDRDLRLRTKEYVAPPNLNSRIIHHFT